MFSEKDELRDSSRKSVASAEFDYSSLSISPPPFQLKAESNTELGEEKKSQFNNGGSFQLAAAATNFNHGQDVIQGFGIPDWLEDAGKAVTGGASAAWDATKQVGGAIVDTGANAAHHLGNMASNVGGGIVDGVANVAGGVRDGIKTVGGGLWDGATSIVSGVAGGAKDVAGGLWGGIKDVAGGVVKGSAEVGSGLWNGIKRAGGGIAGGASSIFNGDIRGGFSQIGSGLWGGVKNAAGGVASGVGSLGGGVWDGIKNVGGGLKRGAQRFGGGIWNGVKSIGGGLWDGAKNVGGGLLDGAMSVGGGLLKGANNLLNLGIDSTFGFADNLMGPEGTAVNQSDIPASHQFDEFMTDLAYLGDGQHWEGTELTDSDRERLIKNGYDPSTFKVHYGSDGLQIITVMPAAGSKGVNPYMAVRGSEANAGNGAADWGSDFEWDQVGDTQYENNEEMIRGILEGMTMGPDGEITNRVSMSGHSLGGALAQRITANHPELVSSLTTFQAPGQSQDVIDTYNQNIAGMDPDDVPDINHHIARDGTVYKVGEASLPGNFYLHDTGLNDLYSTHVATLVDQQGRNGDSATNHSVTRYDEHPNPHVRMFHEVMRKGLGSVISPLLLGAHKKWGEN